MPIILLVPFFHYMVYIMFCTSCCSMDGAIGTAFLSGSLRQSNDLL